MPSCVSAAAYFRHRKMGSLFGAGSWRKSTEQNAKATSKLSFRKCGLPRVFIHLYSVEVLIDLVLCHQLIVSPLFHDHPLALGHVVRKLGFRILPAEWLGSYEASVDSRPKQLER